VDNSTQNYYDHRDALRKAYKHEGLPGRLQIEVAYDHEINTLTVQDNANGMSIEELERAVVLDRPPPNTSGRCEYGMGLKTAACWFGTTWEIRTTRLGSSKELIVSVHIPDLVKKHIENLEVKERSTELNNHFTKITIRGLYNPIRGRTSSRIQDQLGSMYRADLRSGEIEILWNGTPVTFEEPRFLEENLPGGIKNIWRKEIRLKVHWEGKHETLGATGWVGIRTPGSQRDAGFVLMRRGRVVVGGPGEGYKPLEIFSQGNTFRSQRLVGELQMDDWPVTQAKDAFDWSGELEDAFIEELKKVSRDYMEKAEVHRERGKPVTRAEMELASENTRQLFSEQRFGTGLAEDLKFPEPPKTAEQEISDARKLKEISETPLQYRLQVGKDTWIFRLHWQDQLSDANWMSVSYPQDNQIDIFLNMAHPFFEPYISNPGFLELLQKFVLSLALAEKMARQTAKNGLVSPEDFRVYMNRVLRRASSIEAYGNA
jgi:hypothetical protein